MSEKRVTVFLNEEIKHEIVSKVTTDLLHQVHEMLMQETGEAWGFSMFGNVGTPRKTSIFSCDKFRVDFEIKDVSVLDSL